METLVYLFLLLLNLFTAGVGFLLILTIVYYLLKKN